MGIRTCLGGQFCRPTPIRISGIANAAPVAVGIDLPPVASIAAGAGHTCVQTKDGRAFCWGLNDSGQLGAGTANASKPVQVPLP